MAYKDFDDYYKHNKELEKLEELGEKILASEYGDEPKIKGLVLYDIIEKGLKEHEQYKATEEELGIDLNLLPKILKAKYIFVKEYESYGALYFTIRDGKVWFDIPYPVDIHGWVEFKDYGKTWALTKEELL